MPLDDTWFATDLPILEAVVSLLNEQREAVPMADVATRTGLSPEVVSRSIVRLEGQYVDVAWPPGMQGGTFGRVRAVTSAARQAVGQWPSAEGLVDRVLAELDDRVDAAGDEAERSRWIKIRDGVAGAGRDVLVDVLGTAVSRSMGGL